MNAADNDDKPRDGSSAPVSNPQPGSGEGAETAFQAMIRKRKLRAEDDAPAAADDSEPGLSTP